MTSSQRSDPAALPPVADIVRRHDPDRYLTALFAPAAARPALFTLYAFNHELARAHEAAREPGLALIRLQWWREVVEGAVRHHEVATPLTEALSAGALSRTPLLAMVEAREAELEPAATLDALVARLDQGAGSLAAAAGEALGATGEELARLRRLGAGIGLAGLLRNAPALAHLGRSQIPVDLLARHGGMATPALAELAGEASRILGKPEPMRVSVAAAGLPAILARRDLHRPPRAERGIGDRLAVVSAALRGVV